MAILVSKQASLDFPAVTTAVRTTDYLCPQDHCLYDLLIRYKSGEMSNLHVPVIISNHPDLKPVADMFGVEFRCLPIVEKGGSTLIKSTDSLES